MILLKLSIRIKDNTESSASLKVCSFLVRLTIFADSFEYECKYYYLVIYLRQNQVRLPILDCFRRELKSTIMLSEKSEISILLAVQFSGN